MNFDHRKIEPKWQKVWEKEKTFKTEENSEKEKFYILDMFPYPSGAGLMHRLLVMQPVLMA